MWLLALMWKPHCLLRYARNVLCGGTSLAGSGAPVLSRQDQCEAPGMKGGASSSAAGPLLPRRPVGGLAPAPRPLGRPSSAWGCWHRGGPEAPCRARFWRESWLELGSPGLQAPSVSDCGRSNPGPLPGAAPRGRVTGGGAACGAQISLGGEADLWCPGTLWHLAPPPPSELRAEHRERGAS